LYLYVVVCLIVMVDIGNPGFAQFKHYSCQGETPDAVFAQLMTIRPANAMKGPAAGLLAPDEPDPITVLNEDGASAFIIVADHGGNRFPSALGRLGVSPAECERHIAWDIGIAGVCRLLGDALDACVVQQNYSRLVIDCNRPPGSDTSMPVVSELTSVPGNVGLSEQDKATRISEIFQPYHGRIKSELDWRRELSRDAVLIAMHSFTPTFKGEARPWHVGTLYNRDPRFANRVFALLAKEPGLVVGDNQPYSVTDTSDYTIPVHGEQRGLLHVGIEIRQDLIADEAGQRTWANLLGRVLPPACTRVLEQS
jgi:predicted N-formylglutamate amidohydrolase